MDDALTRRRITEVNARVVEELVRAKADPAKAREWLAGATVRFDDSAETRLLDAIAQKLIPPTWHWELLRTLGGGGHVVILRVD